MLEHNKKKLVSIELSTALFLKNLVYRIQLSVSAEDFESTALETMRVKQDLETAIMRAEPTEDSVKT